MLWDDLIPFPSIISPFEGHHDSETNGEVEDNVVDGIEKLREDIGVDFRVNIVGPHEYPESKCYLCLRKLIIFCTCPGCSRVLQSL